MSWQRISDAGVTCGAIWRHDSGWEIRHCGHPTANWPYILIDPKTQVGITSHNGLGFKTLNAAKTVVGGLCYGYFKLSADGSTVANATAFGRRTEN